MEQYIAESTSTCVSRIRFLHSLGMGRISRFAGEWTRKFRADVSRKEVGFHLNSLRVERVRPSRKRPTRNPRGV